jgi:hypothetical protein
MEFAHIFTAPALEYFHPVTRRVIEMDLIYLLAVAMLLAALVGLVQMCAKLARPA